MEVKIALVEKLVDAGLSVVEVGSFVSPKWVPQMAGSGEVYHGIQQREGVSYPMLVPNAKGMEGALAAGVRKLRFLPPLLKPLPRRILIAALVRV